MCRSSGKIDALVRQFTPRIGAVRWLKIEVIIDRIVYFTKVKVLAIVIVLMKSASVGEIETVSRGKSCTVLPIRPQFPSIEMREYQFNCTFER
jgi:hypothetical protein